MTIGAYLKEYELQLSELSKASIFLDIRTESDFREKLERTLALLSLHRTVSERYVIGVSGFQGSGKSTFINYLLFEDPEGNEWLPQNVGIGENLPVLLTISEDVSEISATLTKVQFDPENLDSHITKEEIFSAKDCQDRLKMPDNRDVLVEITLPLPSILVEQEDHFFFDDISFLLLPGFERITQKSSDLKKYRQEFMLNALTACANCYLIIDPNQLSRGDQKEVLEKINDLFGESDALYVLTHEDQISQGRLGDARKSLESTGIKEDRIYSSGVETNALTREDINKRRLEIFKKTSSIHRNSIQTFKKVQKQQLYNIITDINDLIREIEYQKNEIDFKTDDNDQKVKNFIQAYDSSADRILEDLLNRIKDAFDKIGIKAGKSLEDEYHKDKIGRVSQWWEELWNGPVPLKKLEEEVTGYIEEEVKKRSDKGVIGIVENCITKTLDDSGVYANISKGDLKQLPAQDYQLDNEKLKNINFLIGTNPAKPSQTEMKEFKRATELVPYLITDSLRVSAVVNDPGWISTIKDDPINRFENFQRKIPMDEIDIKSLLSGMLIVLGIDVLPDGQFDTINDLFAAISAQNAISGGLSLASASLMGAAIIYGGIKVNNATIRHRIKRVDDLKELSRLIVESHISEIYQALFRMFRKIRELIEYRLREYLGVDEMNGKVLHLEHEIHRTRSLTEEILSELEM